MFIKCMNFEEAITSLLTSQSSIVTFQDFQLELVDNGNPLPNYFVDTNCEKYLLLSKVKKKISSTSSFDPVKISPPLIEPNDETFEVSGSPLKLHDFQADYSSRTDLKFDKIKQFLKFYETYKCWLKERGTMSSVDARMFLSKFLNVDGKLCGQLWTCCDMDPIVFLAIDLNENKDSNLHIAVQYLGKVDTFMDSIKIGNIVPSQLKHSRWMECNARYMLFEQKYSGNHCSYIEAEISWQSERIAVQKPPYNAKTILNLNVKSPEDSSPTVSIYSEIQTLQDLVDCFNKKGTSFASSNSYNHSPDNHILAQLEKLFEDCQQTEAYMKVASITDVDEAEVFKSNFLNFKNRENFDFTELLWNNIKGCLNYDDLTTCLVSVLNNVQNSSIQPMVINENLTTLANLIRRSYTNKITNYEIKDHLAGMKPVEIIVEIGMFKILQDIKFILFGEEYLLPINYFNYFFTNFNSSSIDERMTKIHKLNIIIESIFILEKNLNLSQYTIEQILSSMLKNMKNMLLNDCFLQSISVPGISIASCIDTLDPYFWSGKVSKQHQEMTIILSNYFPYHHVIPTIDSNKNTSEFHISTIQQYDNKF